MMMVVALFTDRGQQVCGIMNGTTNFMLSKMESEGADYGDVLKEAQDLGFAEGTNTSDSTTYTCSVVGGGANSCLI